jgi:hypothetical protein
MAYSEPARTATRRVPRILGAGPLVVKATRRRQLDAFHTGRNRYTLFTRAEVWPSGPDYCAGRPTLRENNPLGPHRPTMPILRDASVSDNRSPNDSSRQPKASMP